MRTLHRHVRSPANTVDSPRLLWKYCHATDRAVVHPTLEARRSMGAASEGWQALVLAMATGAMEPDRAPIPTAATARIVVFITGCIGKEMQGLDRASAGNVAPVAATCASPSRRRPPTASTPPSSSATPTPDSRP